VSEDASQKSLQRFSQAELFGPKNSDYQHYEAAGGDDRDSHVNLLLMDD
jgi:hypothetical protein